MAGRRQRTNPLDAALARLAELAGRGVQPGRMAREVEAIVAGWNAAATDADTVCEWLGELKERLGAGADDAAEQLADVDRSEPAAVRHAGVVHAALVGGVTAVDQAIVVHEQAQRVEA